MQSPKTAFSLFKVSRTVALLLAVVLLAVPMLSTSAASNPVISAVKCDSPGKLTMWVWDETWQKTIKASIDQWVKNYCPGAEVDVQVHPWGEYWDTLKTNAAAGDLPDVFNMSQDNFFFYASNDALLDLQPYWDKAKVDTKVWGTGLVDPYRWGDKKDLYAGPVNWDTVAIYYNKDMFKAAGVTLPTADWTWDDFAAAAAKLTDKAKDVYGAAVYMGYQTGYPNWIASTGTTPVVDAAHTQCTLGDKGSLEALNFLKGLFDKGYMPSVAILGGSGADDAFKFFSSGKVAMITGGSWKLPDAQKITFNWDVVQLPKNPTSKLSRAILHAVGYVASARTKNPDLAGNLITYLVSDEGQKFFAQAGGVAPANPSPELQDLWMKSFPADKNVKAFPDATKDSQGVTAFAEIWSVADTELPTNLFGGGMSVDEAVKAACDAINKNLVPKK